MGLDYGQKKKITHNIRKKNGAIMITWQHGLENRGYEPRTEMENLITNIFSFYESEIENHVSDYDTENGNFDGTYTEAAQAYVIDSGGLSEFDYEV